MRYDSALANIVSLRQDEGLGSLANFENDIKKKGVCLFGELRLTKKGVSLFLNVGSRTRNMQMEPFGVV